MNLMDQAFQVCEELRKSYTPRKEFHISLIESILRDTRFRMGIEHIAIRYLVGGRKIIVNYSQESLSDLLSNYRVLITRWKDKKEKI